MPTTTRSASRDVCDLHLLPPVRRQVLLVGVSDVVAAGLASVMGGRPEIELRAAEPTLAATTGADVVIVDVVTAARSGGLVSPGGLPCRTGTAVLALYPEARPDLARLALARGADGLVSAAWPSGKVVETIRDAMEGRFVRPESLTRQVASGSRSSPESRSIDLSPRELVVLCRIASGQSNQEIAEELFVSINTVKTYIRGAYRRIGVQTRPQAMVWFFGHGLGDCLPPSAGAPGDGDVRTGSELRSRPAAASRVRY